MTATMTTTALRSYFGDRQAARLMVLRSRVADRKEPPRLDGTTRYPDLARTTTR